MNQYFLALLLLVPCAAQAASAGRTGLDFLSLDFGPRQTAMGGAGVAIGSLLESAKATVVVHSSTQCAVIAFYRAFNTPRLVATSLGVWAGFSEENQGVSSEALEAEFGELLRSNIR